MASVAGKQFGTYYRTERTKALEAELKAKYPDKVLVMNNPHGANGERGTLICAELAIDFARFISPAFHLQVIEWATRVMTGDLSLVQEVVANYDARNGTSSAVQVHSVEQSIAHLAASNPEQYIRVKELENKTKELENKTKELEIRKVEVERDAEIRRAKVENERREIEVKAHVARNHEREVELRVEREARIRANSNLRAPPPATAEQGSAPTDPVRTAVEEFVQTKLAFDPSVYVRNHELEAALRAYVLSIRGSLQNGLKPWKDACKTALRARDVGLRKLHRPWPMEDGRDCHSSFWIGVRVL
jgi:hypothetical protein